MPSHDVLIAGGGIIGCALAEELARRGTRVLLLERGTIGAESSSAAAGILSAQMDVPQPGVFFDLCQMARRAYPSWIKRLEHLAGQHVEFAVNGVLYLAATRAQAARMRRRAQWQKRAGCPVERLSPPAIRYREPAVDGRFVQGFLFPLEGQVDNAQLMGVLARACRRAGVVVREQHRVKRLLIRRGAVAGVVTHRGTFRAPVVVDTLGSWAPLGKQLPLPVEPARGQILCFQGPKHLFRRPVMTERAYVVQRDDGRLLLGSTIEHVGFNKSLTVQGMHRIVCGARKISRRLEDTTFLEGWAGLRPYSRTGDPILGPTRTPGLYVATGHFRHGILLAPTTATLMADVILRGRSAVDLRSFAP